MGRSRNGHRWHHAEGSHRICVKCGTERRTKKSCGIGQYEFKQWWGSWYPLTVPCAPIEERQRIWEAINNA